MCTFHQHSLALAYWWVQRTGRKRNSGLPSPSLPFSTRASLVGQMVKNLPAMWETRVRSLGREDPLEKGMAPHSSTLAWRIPWMEEPGGLQSTGSQRVGHDRASNPALLLPFLPVIIFTLRGCLIQESDMSKKECARAPWSHMFLRRSQHSLCVQRQFSCAWRAGLPVLSTPSLSQQYM